MPRGTWVDLQQCWAAACAMEGPRADEHANKSNRDWGLLSSLTRGCWLLPVSLTPNQSSCRSSSATSDSTTFSHWVPALMETFSFTSQPVASWTEGPRGCRRWWEGLGGRQPRAENGRKATLLPGGSISEEAARRLEPACPPVLPGISESQPQFLLTAKYFTPETCYASWYRMHLYVSRWP